MTPLISLASSALAIAAAPGREQPAIDFINLWTASRPWCETRRDHSGNLILRAAREPKGPPLYLAAHLDHPNFIVETLPHSPREALLLRRGGHPSELLTNTPVIIRSHARIIRGTLHEITDPTPGSVRARASFDSPPAPGDVASYDVDEPGRTDSELFGLACDNMIGVAALLAAFESTRDHRPHGPVRLLLTRAEELGMLGALALCRAGLLGPCARVLTVDARDAAPGSGILAAGPASLTRDLAALGLTPTDQAAADRTEAAAFSAFGHEAGAILYPIRNMHNAGTPPQPERIAIADLVLLHDALARTITDCPHATRRDAMNDHWRTWGSALS